MLSILFSTSHHFIRHFDSFWEERWADIHSPSLVFPLHKWGAWKLASRNRTLLKNFNPCKIFSRKNGWKLFLSTSLHLKCHSNVNLLFVYLRFKQDSVQSILLMFIRIQAFCKIAIWSWTEQGGHFAESLCVCDRGSIVPLSQAAAGCGTRVRERRWAVIRKRRKCGCAFENGTQTWQSGFYSQEAISNQKI